jgi:hypothetical protein
MARIAPSQPNDAMARIVSRRNSTISLDPNLPGQNSRERFFRRIFKIFLESTHGFESRIGLHMGLPATITTTTTTTTRTKANPNSWCQETRKLLRHQEIREIARKSPGNYLNSAGYLVYLRLRCSDEPQEEKK